MRWNLKWIISLNLISLFGLHIHPVTTSSFLYDFFWKITLWVGIKLMYCLLVSKIGLAKLNWLYLLIAWVLTPCYRSKNVLKSSKESISINKSFYSFLTGLKIPSEPLTLLRTLSYIWNHVWCVFVWFMASWSSLASKMLCLFHLDWTKNTLRTLIPIRDS